jgi:hypothetical protein
VTGIYTNIDSTNEGQGITQLQQGYYAFDGITPSSLPAIFGKGGYTIGVLGFVDISAGSGSTAAGWVKDATWSLDALFNAVDRTKVLVGVVFYNSAGAGTIGGLLDCKSFLPASYAAGAGMFRAYVSPYYTSSTVYSLAYRLASGLDGSLAQPFTYVLDWATGRILDKFHRGSRYSGEGGYPRKADLYRLGWDGSAATNETMYSYLSWRLEDHLAPTRTIGILPEDADNLLGGHPRVRNGSRFSALFSQKALGASLAASWIFNDGASDLAGPLVDPIDADVAWTGFAAAHSEGRDMVFSSPPASTTGKTLTLKTPSASLVDSRGQGFSSSAAFVVDPAGDTPSCAIALSGGAASADLMAVGQVPTWTQSGCLLSVEVRTAYPTASQPTGRVLKPDGTTALVLSFSHYAATLDETVLDEDGIYTVVVDAFANNASNTMPATIRRFAMARNLAAGTAVRTVEGWGYYPREEGLPGSSADSAFHAHGDTGWLMDHALPVAAPAPGSRLCLTASAAGPSWHRDYACAFGTDGDVTSVGNACAFAEAGFYFGAAPTGPYATVHDESGNTLSLRILGIALELWNGPLKLSAVVVDPGTGPCLALRVLRASDARYKLSSIKIDAGKLHLVRVEYDTATKGYTLRHSALAGPPVLPLAYADSLGVAQDELLSVEGTPYVAGVRFGVLDVCNQGFALEWEFARYGYLDANYAAAVDDPSIFGIVHTMRSGDPGFYRSGDLKIGGSPTGEPADATDNSLSAVIAQKPLASLSGDIPYKVRFFAVDWNETLASGVAGFFKAGFPPCYSAAKPGFAPLSGAGNAVKAGRAPASATGFEVGTLWHFDVQRSNLRRRLLVLAYMDSPFIPTPAILPEAPLAGLLVDDSAAKTDYRCAIRQFLPDFYVRDTPTDHGESPGGAYSPDIAMATYAGAISSGAHQLSDPRGLAESVYPKGFAAGAPLVYDYTPAGVIPIDSTDPAKPIKLTDTAWSDFDGPPAQCFYNRVWVRLSNRGVVPGPANVQVFFLGSALRAAFDPVAARLPAYGAICSDQACGERVQSRFQQYDRTTGALQPSLVEAVPALSGASDPLGAYPYVIAEFLWHVAQGNLPAADADKHGCRAACINLPRPSGATDSETWSRGIDEGPALALPWPSVWSVNSASNNVTVRNSNLVQAVPSDSSHVSLKLRIRNGVPIGYRKLPNDFLQTFGGGKSVWGLSLDATGFVDGDLVLRIDAKAVPSVNLRGFVEAKDETPTGAPTYRFFALRGGAVGTLSGVRALFGRDGMIAAVSLFYVLGSEAKGRYEIVLGQTAGGKVVGSYRTVVLARAIKDIGFVADDREGLVFDVRANPEKLRAIPYEHRAVFAGAGLAVQEGFRLGPALAADFVAGKLANEVVNLPRGFVYPKPTEVLSELPGGLEGLIEGSVLDEHGAGIAGCSVSIQDVIADVEIGHGVSDQLGHYVIRIEAKGGGSKGRRPGKRRVELRVKPPAGFAPRGRSMERKRGYALRDLCFIAEPTVFRRR